MPEIRIKASDGGDFMAYLALPPGGSGPGIVLIQEIFGINHFMRDTADRLAKLGYLVAAPDLFWRQEPGIQLTDKTEKEWARAFELYKGFDEAKGVDDLKATLAHLRTVPGCSGKVGSVGYCLGGKLAYLMATRTDCDASVGYYGVGIEGAVGEASRIARPLMLHIAEEDKFVPKDAQAQVKTALAGNAHVTIHSYPGVDHAFARDGGEHYEPQAATAANARTAQFFKQHLG